MCENTFLDLWRTTNGGVTWESKTNGINAQPFRLFFINYSTGFCGASFTLFKTTNAGDNWVAVNGFSDVIYSMFFLNESTGWLGQSGGKIFYTTNGGNNWIDQGIHNFFNNINDIYFLNSNTGWAGTGGRIKIFKTTNSGMIWGFQTDSSTSKNISVIDSMKAWTGDFGISHTSNGGGTITHINSYINILPTEFIL